MKTAKMHETTRSQLHALLDYVQQGHRICPLAGKSNELCEMLPDPTRMGSGWEPPLPFILAAWRTIPHMLKIMRLREQIIYVAEHGVLVKVDRYMRGLAPDDWYYDN